jgi:DNA-directed RNA polymerase subunit H (RpoH/RPB5)
MDFDTIDVLYRSRQTLLAILKAKGYNTTPYEKFGPFEVEAMAAGDREVTLQMDLEREVPADAGIPAKCRVEYAIPKVKNRLAGFLNRLLEDEDGQPVFDPKETEIIVITLEAIGDTFTNAALQRWSSSKLRISFFDANTLVSNPLEHVLVPKHELVPMSDHAELLKRLNCTSKLNLPMIRFHQDMIGRILGIVPGDIVKITRPSPQAGEYVVYRVCVP